MLAFAHQYPHWTDFPNGLRVLVVDTDTQLLAHLKSKLEAFNYEATTFSTSGEAVVALQNRSSVFHAALVEASAENNGDGWKVLEAATHLPVIMMSSIENMDIMMKSLACGACEFLQKPLSDETLKNIWQHVVRKALCTGELLLPDNIWPAKDVELSPPKLDISETNKTESPTRRNLDPSVKVKVELPAVDDEEPANLFIHEDESSTLFDITSGSVGDCYFPCERFLDSPAKLELDHAVETPASQENASNQSPGLHDLISVKAEINGAPHEFPEYDHLFEIKSEPEDVSDGSSADVCGFLGTNMDEDDDMDPSKSKGCSNLQLDEELELDDSLGGIKISNEFVKEGNNTSVSTSCLDGPSVSEGQGLIGIDGLDRNCVDEEAGLLQEVKRAERNLARNTSDIITMSPDTYKATYSDPQERGKTSKVEGKRKLKVDWTPELHRRFVQAVEQLGVDKAIPSRILEIMGGQCLTRHNIASHLQKYRSHRKHVLVREAEAASWNQRRRSESSPWSSRPRLLPPPPPHHASIAPPMQCRSPLIPIQSHLAPHGHTIAPPPPLHVWGHPTVDHCQIHMWHKPLVATTAWQTSNGTFWQQTCIDTWAHSTVAPGMPCYAQHPMQNKPLMPMPGVAHMTIPILLGESITRSVNEMESTSMNGKLTTSHSPKEMVNAAINEVLANPCTPLPLGLKPPSLESVIHELQRQSLYTPPCELL